ncbi:hypothetical protein AT984_00785 [Paucibacter sp. KCTC 42545]|nr:hypothetical protein AT984_00785 [Paucibacter sp. KCTC 42545]
MAMPAGALFAAGLPMATPFGRHSSATPLHYRAALQCKRAPRPKIAAISAAKAAKAAQQGAAALSN